MARENPEQKENITEEQIKEFKKWHRKLSWSWRTAYLWPAKLKTTAISHMENENFCITLENAMMKNTIIYNPTNNTIEMRDDWQDDPDPKKRKPWMSLLTKWPLDKKELENELKYLNDNFSRTAQYKQSITRILS